MTGDGGLVEVQATAERTPLSRAHLDELLALAAGGHRAAARARRSRRSRRRRRGRVSERPRAREAAARHAQRAQAARVRAAARRRGEALELDALPDDVELPPEDGETFAENALGKARAAARGDGRVEHRRRLRHRGGGARRRAGRALGALRGEDATDEENLAKLLREAPAGSALRVRVRDRLRRPGERASSGVFEGRCAGRAGRARRAASGASATTRRSCPTTGPRGLTMAELSDEQKDAISHRGRAAARAAGVAQQQVDRGRDRDREAERRRSRCSRTSSSSRAVSSATSTVAIQAMRVDGHRRHSCAMRACPHAVLASRQRFHERGGRSDEVRAGRPGRRPRRADQAGCRARGGAVLATVEDALRRGSEVTVSGFGKFHVSERGRAQGVNPRTGERIQIAASRVPALHRRQRPEERGEGALSRRAASATRWPRGSPSASRRSCSASTPIPARCGRRRARARPRRRRRRRERGRRGGARPLPRADRRDGAGVRRRQAAARPLRGARAPPGWTALGGGRRARARRAACS